MNSLCGHERVVEAEHEGSNHAATLSVMAHKLILCTEPRVLAVQCAMRIYAGI